MPINVGYQCPLMNSELSKSGQRTNLLNRKQALVKRISYIRHFGKSFAQQI